MVLEAVRDLHKLFIALGKILLQSGDGLGCPDTGNHVLTLRIDQVLAVNALCAGGRVSGKGNACAGGISHITEYHRLHVYCRAPVAGDIVHTSVDNRSLVVPGTENRLHRLHQLYLGILRELLALIFLIDILETDNDLFHIVRRQIGVILDALALLDLVQNPLKIGFRNLHHDIREHLNKSAVGIICKPGISGLSGKALHGCIRKTQIQDGIHHTRHGSSRAGTHRYQQRIGRIAELLALLFLQSRKRCKDLSFDLLGDLPAVIVIIRTSLRGHGKALRDRQTQIRHLRQVSALTAQEITHIRIPFFKQINPFRHIAHYAPFSACESSLKQAAKLASILPYI